MESPAAESSYLQKQNHCRDTYFEVVYSWWVGSDADGEHVGSVNMSPGTRFPLEQTPHALLGHCWHIRPSPHLSIRHSLSQPRAFFFLSCDFWRGFVPVLTLQGPLAIRRSSGVRVQAFPDEINLVQATLFLSRTQQELL